MVKNENEIHQMSRGKVMTNANALDGVLSLRFNFILDDITISY